MVKTSRSPARCTPACELGDEIPVDLYNAVARVLAFVMALKARGSGATASTPCRVAPSPRASRPPHMNHTLAEPLAKNRNSLSRSASSASSCCSSCRCRACLLDMLIIVNILLALVILLTTMFVKKPLDFSVFPSLLLVATLFRLGLNVASTRLVLGRGYAGQVIQAFGHVAVGGSIIIGAVIFLILVVIQFVVVTKGAERVAEVGARFTLDAMPGKQMAIDADLNAGLITDETRPAAPGRGRRPRPTSTARWTAPRSSSRATRSPGILIIIINIIGGIAIGMMQRGIADRRRAQHVHPADHRRRPRHPDPRAADGRLHRHDRHALERRVRHRLDGRRAAHAVAQRADDRRRRGDRDGAHPRHADPSRSCSWAAFLILIGPAHQGAQAAAQKAEAANGGSGEGAPRRRPPTTSSSRCACTRSRSSSPPTSSTSSRGASDDLLARVRALRRKIAIELGIVVPPVRTRDSVELPPSTYVIRIAGVEAGRGIAPSGKVLALGDSLDALPGTSTVEPVFGLAGKWIPAEMRHSAEMTGATVIDRVSVLVTHLSSIITANAARLLTPRGRARAHRGREAGQPVGRRRAHPRPAHPRRGAARAAGPARRSRSRSTTCRASTRRSRCARRCRPTRRAWSRRRARRSARRSSPSTSTAAPCASS